MKHFILLNFVIFTSIAIFGQSGIKGLVTDGDTKEPVPFANVVKKGTSTGATTDFDGLYKLSLPAGSHTIVVSYVGYGDKEIEVVVKEGEFTDYNVVLGEDPEIIGVVVVKGTFKKKSDEAAVVDIKTSVEAKNVTTGQEMKEKGKSNVQSAVKVITGVSADRDGDVNVRGMNARYISVGINGVVIPGTDPDKNSVQLDLIPTSIVEAIDVSKTFLPDQPGNSTGGSINIKLTDTPEDPFFKISASVGVNDMTTFNPNFRTYEGGSLDWLGFDDGTRQLSSSLMDTTDLFTKSSGIKARSNDSIATLVDASAKSLSREMISSLNTTPLFNRSFSISRGDKISMGKNNKGHERMLGYILNAGYRMNYGYRGTQFTNWNYQTDTTAFDEKFDLRDERGQSNPMLMGIAGVSYEPWEKQKFVANFMYNHSAQKTARSLEGSFRDMISAENTYFSHALGWVERSMINTQLIGSHAFRHDNKDSNVAIKNVQFNWAYDYFNFVQEEPDLRFFSYDVNGEDSNATYYISKAEYTVPAHFWRDLRDQQHAFKADLKIPLFQNDNEKILNKNFIKLGTMYSSKTRSFGETTLLVENRRMSTVFNELDGDASLYFADENMGVEFNPNGSNTVNNYIEDNTDLANSYTGIYNTFANYAMMSYNPIKRIKTTFGARAEKTFITAKSADPIVDSLFSDSVNVLDILPAFNMTIKLDKKGDMQLRLSATQTVAKPTMREVAPFESFQFIGGPLIVGNSQLNRSLITNYDVRWEYYFREEKIKNNGKKDTVPSGEMISLAGYSKTFKDGISRSFNPYASKDEITWFNVENASLHGAEVELRKKLRFISSEDDSSSQFNLNTNFSYIVSSMQVDTINPDASRPLTGQSKYLYNLGLNYKNKHTGWNVTLSGNYFSNRLAIINGALPIRDIYEAGRFALDLIAIKKMNDKLTLTFSAKNLINPDVKLYIRSNGVEGFEDGYNFNSYKAGRTFSIGLKYDIYGGGKKDKEIEKKKG